MLTNSPARTPSAVAIAIVSLVRLLCMKIGAESAQPSFNDLSRCRQPVRPIPPVFTTAPSTILGPRILTEILPQSLIITAMRDQADRHGLPG
jgi:hypothetical protein